MPKPKKAMGVQQNLISTDQETQGVLEHICSESNKLHNCAVYYARQMWFKTKTFVTGFDLVNEMRKSGNARFSALPSYVAEQACISVGESIKLFSELLKKSRKGDLEGVMHV